MSLLQTTYVCTISIDVELSSRIEDISYDVVKYRSSERDNGNFGLRAEFIAEKNAVDSERDSMTVSYNIYESQLLQLLAEEARETCESILYHKCPYAMCREGNARRA
ncbi:hypothetical protein Tco_0087040 [Tanacetum coccineum]